MQTEIQWLTIGNKVTRASYLDTRDIFPFYTLCLHDLVRMVIKYPGIDSYQTKRKKVSSESHSFNLQTAVQESTTMATTLLQ